MARVSEWAVVSEVDTLRLRLFTTTSPSITTTAPNGCSPSAAPARASSNAMSMNLSCSLISFSSAAAATLRPEAVDRRFHFLVALAMSRSACAGRKSRTKTSRTSGTRLSP
jgi:hypothetical protein